MNFTHNIRLSFLFGITILVSGATFLLTNPAGFHIRNSSFFLNPLPIRAKISSASTTRIPPTQIRFPSLGKSLPISASIVLENEWEVFDNKVSWLSTSAVPGEGENIILYAHNTPELFGDINKLAVGDMIEIQQDQSLVTYVVTENKKIKPTDVDEVILDADQLTIYTCAGSFNQKRRVIYAEPL